MTTQPDGEHVMLHKEDHAIHYVAKGSSQHELIVFLHPAFSDHTCFYQQIDVFAEKYRVVAVDMLGHGKSQVKGSRVTIVDTSAIVAEIIAREGYESAHLVGVSLGSLIAQDVAAKFPHRVKTITVVGGYSIFGDNQEIQRAQAAQIFKIVVMILISMQRFRRHVGRASVIQPEAQEMIYRSTQPFTRRSLRVMAGMSRLLRPQYQPHQHPLNIVVGEHDIPVALSAAAVWHQKEPASEYHTLRNAGHCANMDNAHDFNALLLRFIAQPNAEPVSKLAA